MRIPESIRDEWGDIRSLIIHSQSYELAVILRDWIKRYDGTSEWYLMGDKLATDLLNDNINNSLSQKNKDEIVKLIKHINRPQRRREFLDDLLSD